MIMSRKHWNRAFSLIELVIVIVIIGIIAAIAVPRMSRGAAGANDAALRADLEASGETLELWFERVAPVWNTVGRVYFHLAENPGNDRAPFAFLATYVREMSARSTVRHVPLGRALEEFSGDRDALLRLLRPVHLATEKSEVVKDLISSGYQGFISIEPHMKGQVHLGDDTGSASGAFETYVEYGRRMAAILQEAQA